MTAMPNEAPQRPQALHVIPGNIPREMRIFDRWLVWKYELTEDGKWTKVPYNARTGRKASSTNPGTWASFTDAIAAYRSEKYDGIGFVPGPDIGIVGVDIDHCLDDNGGITSTAAKKIAATFNSYTEMSPGSNGLRIFTRGRVEMGERKGGQRRDGVEVYPRGQYLTCTGHRIDGYAETIVDAPDGALQALWDSLNPPRHDEERPKSGTRHRAEEAPADDLALIEMARNASNGNKFSRLWSGDTSDASGDDSVADLALCAILAFWTGRDGARMDRLFRQSGLVRNKWDERRGASTYGSATIEKAIANCSDVYKPRLRVVRSNSEEDGADHVPPTSTEAVHFTDMWNAQRFVAEHGSDIRWCKSLGGWLVWDGGRWIADDTYGVMRHAKLTTRAMLAEAAKTPTDERMKALASHALKSQSESRLNAMINLAKSEPGIATVPEAFDADPWLINVHNGTIDLRTGTCRAHRREDLLTKTALVDYDPHATCPTFLTFLHDIMKGRAELVDFLQHAIGYTLVGTTREQIMLILHGGGANGKSTLIETLMGMLGDYARSMPSDALMVKRGDDGPKNEIARLRGVRLAAAVESDEGRRFSEAFVKQITGTDTVTVRHLYNDFFDMRPEFTVWLSTNHKPQIKNTDHGIWRRIRLVPFDVTFKERSATDGDSVLCKDEQMPERLRQELPGILNWVIQGCLAWQRDGLPVPEPVKKATEGYRAEMDLVAAWIADCCIISPTAEETATELHKSYAAWCEENGERSMTSRALAGRFKDREFTQTRSTTARKWCGIRLRAPTEAREEREQGAI